MPRTTRRTRLSVAITLLAALLLGYAAHGWHHLTDPACDAQGAHPCIACSALHASVLVGEGVVSIAPTVTIERDAVLMPDSRALTAPTTSATRPRAPPAS